MGKIAVVPNEHKDVQFQETRLVVHLLRRRGKEVLIDDSLKQFELGDACYLPREEMFQSASLIVVLGGDGTILNIAVEAAMYDIPIIGINLGTLGFLSQAERGDTSIFDDIFDGNYSITKCMMMDASIMKNGEELERFIALNDIVVSSSEYSNIIKVSASVDGTGIGSYSADGLIVASAVGSTAYSLSAGGAILHPSMDAMIITPICPHTLKARSMVIPGELPVEVQTEPPYRVDAAVTIDGKKRHILKQDEFVRITRSKYTTSLMRLNQRNFFDVLREKLSDR